MVKEKAAFLTLFVSGLGDVCWTHILGLGMEGFILVRFRGVGEPGQQGEASCERLSAATPSESKHQSEFNKSSSKQGESCMLIRNILHRACLLSAFLPPQTRSCRSRQNSPSELESNLIVSPYFLIPPPPPPPPLQNSGPRRMWIEFQNMG